MSVHHSYVYDSSKVDASVFRNEAQRRAFDDRDPADTTIHFHAYDENGHYCKPDIRHEYYKVGKGLVEKSS